MAAIATSLGIAAATHGALAADEGKAETKATPASDEARDVKDAPEAKGVKAAGPHLRMAAHHGRNPGKDVDLRHCLDLGTAKEVIRCSEQK
ncbi:MAG TPA: hypothetical protein VN782_14885 [Usitatibacter sp.]|nr:hypothetical protein [Usitatibacter sp.]